MNKLTFDQCEHAEGSKGMRWSKYEEAILDTIYTRLMHQPRQRYTIRKETVESSKAARNEYTQRINNCHVKYE
jgi:hypothetical protein